MRKLVMLLGCFAAGPVAAADGKLTGEVIKTTLSGSLLALDTPVGSTVSVRIGHDGMMEGEAGTALGAVLGAAKDRGRWWVANDRVCFKWFRWFDAEQRCATISVEGKRFTWRRDDGDTGTGTIVELGGPVSKSAQIVAEVKKAAPAHEVAERKQDVVLAASERKAEAAAKAEEHKSLASAEKATASDASEPAVKPMTAVALNVPAPHPAVRPHHSDSVAIASVKPQFFKTPKSAASRVQPAKVEVAKAEAPKTVGKPFRVAGVDPSDVLNIRTGPSPDYQTVGRIPPNSHGIAITGACLNDWCPVRHRTLVGWVNRRYLAEETAANTAAASDLNYWDDGAK
ncbi:MAG: SH3 domain-containing protein [Hyphomicrobium sp.]|uniref:SH3 domain-containing protein n=1 Tax=Hyphomicrobium sp. TaxID=82 RepID=UPI0039E4912B